MCCNFELNPSSGLEMLSLISIFENKVFKMNVSIGKHKYRGAQNSNSIQNTALHPSYILPNPRKIFPFTLWWNTPWRLHKYISHPAQIHRPSCRNTMATRLDRIYSWKGTKIQLEDAPGRGGAKEGVEEKSWRFKYLLKW